MSGNAAQRLDRDRLRRAGRSIEPRLAHQARPAVDLGAARAALGGLAVPAHGEVRRLACAGSRAPRRARPCPLGLDLVVDELAARRVAAPQLAASACSSRAPPPCVRVDERRQLVGLDDRPRLERASRPPSLRDDDVVLAPVVVVRPGKSSRLCAPRLSWRMQRGARDRLGDDQHVVQVAAQVPARVEGARRLDAAPAFGRAPLELLESRRARRSGRPRRGRCRRRAASSPAARRGARRGPRRPAGRGSASSSRRGVGDCGVVDRAAAPAPAWPAAASPARRPNTSRSESELPPSRLAPFIPPEHSPAAKRPGTRLCAGLGVDADAAHEVVARRPDLHRLARDVDAGELHELVVHARQLASGPSSARQVRDVEETPPCGVPRPSLTSV